MSKNIKSIQLEFENLENATIPVSAIKEFRASDISESMDIDFDYWNKEARIDRHLVPEYCEIEMNLEVLEDISTNYGYTAAYHLTTFNDISYITINYQDGASLNLAMPYYSNEYEDNEWQEHKVNEHPMMLADYKESLKNSPFKSEKDRNELIEAFKEDPFSEKKTIEISISKKQLSNY